MRKLQVALGGLFLCLAANAQNVAIGTLTASGADCTTAGACITLQFEGNDVASASIQLSGTFTATVQFEASSDKGTTWVAINGTPLNGTTAVTSATTANTWKFNVASITNIRARCSAWTSAPTVVIRSSRAVANAIGGGGAVFASGGTTANLIPKENGSSALVDSLLSDSGSALTYNAKAVPSFTTGGATTNTIPKTSGTGGLIADSSITDDGTTVTSAEVINLTHAADTTNAIIKFNSVAIAGLMFGSANQVGLKANATTWLALDTSSTQAVNIPSGSLLGWSGSNTFGASNVDTMMGRRGAANFRFGNPDNNGAVNAQTIGVQNAVTGTDLAGADFTIAGPLGTGAGAPHAVNIQGPNVLATGGTSQTEVLALGTRWFKALTNNTVTTVANVTDASNTAAAIIVHYGIEVFDGTNLQWETGLVMCGINNKAGVFAQNTCTKSGNAPGLGSGTLTVTWTITGANPALLQINSNSSLTTTTNRLYYNIENLTNQAVTEQ